MPRHVLALLLLAACGDPLGTELNDPDQTPQDVDGPEIDHDAITAPQSFGQDLFVEAIVSDVDSDILVVDLVYQAETSSLWITKSMHDVGNGLYQGRIDGGDVQSGGMRYYIRATDIEGNESCLPDDCEDAPWYFTVVH